MRKYPYLVRWIRERNQRRVVGLISALFLIVTPTLASSNSSAATIPTQTLTISNLQIRAIGAGMVRHEVTLSGILRNDSAKTLKTQKIRLTTFGPLKSRTQVAQVNAGELNTQGYAKNITSVLSEVVSNGTTKWSLVFIGEDVLGRNAAGVFSFGVQLTNNSGVADAIAVPWFYNSKKLAPTNVVFAIPISALETANFGMTDTPSTDVTQDISRIEELTSAKSASRIGWIVDPEIKHVLTETALSKTNPAQVAKVSAQLEMLAPTSTSSPYGNADLGAMYRAKLKSDVDTSISISANALPVIYQPTGSAIDKGTLKALHRKNVTALVGNDSLSNSALNTIDVEVSLHGSTSLVFDVGASDCLKNSDTAVDAFTEQQCLAGQIAMMTAESPSNSRTIIVLAPMNWDVSAAHLDQLISGLSDQNWVALSSWDAALAENHVPHIVSSNKRTYSALSAAFTNNVKKLGSYTLRLSQAVADPVVQGELTRVRLNSYSTRWQNQALAARYVATNVNILSNVNSSIKIQATNRITTSNAQSSIPITVANNSGYDINVRVQLVTTSSERISSDGSDITNIPHGKRVTIAVPITLNGTGAVKVTAVLRTADGTGIGIGARLEIASSTFERLARALVIGAFTLLIILAISNFIRRKSRDGEAHLDNESVGE